MTDLELYLDHNMIYRNDGSFVLNSKYDVFVRGLEAIIQRERERVIDNAADQISRIKADFYGQDEHSADKINRIKSDFYEQDELPLITGA